MKLHTTQQLNIGYGMSSLYAYQTAESVTVIQTSCSKLCPAFLNLK